MSACNIEAGCNLDQPYDDEHQADGIVETVIREETTTARPLAHLIIVRLGLRVLYKEHPG
jgi:hypothetical protein